MGESVVDIGEIIDQLEQQRKEQDSIYHNVAVKQGLSDTAFYILYVLHIADGDFTQQDLIRQCFAPKQTINTAISGLVKKGYLTLEMIPGTRNLKRIILTESGRVLAKTAVGPMRQAELRAYGSLSEEELRQYLELTERLTVNLRKETQEL